MTRVWVSCGFLPEEDVLELAPAIESLGFDGLTLPDHLFTPVDDGGRYPYSADGRPPFGAQTPWPDALTLLAAVAARTSSLELMTAVAVLPLRHPVVLAKAAATVARISAGRLVLGVGAGWQREEFDAVGSDFDRRGTLTSEAIDALRALWGPQPAEHHGRVHDLGPLEMHPRPPVIPVIVGGGSDAALRRAARAGDGWIAPTGPLADMPGEVARMRAALAAKERLADHFRIVVPCLDAPGEAIVPVLSQDVTDITIMPWPHPGRQPTPVAQKIESLRRWQDDVRPSLGVGFAETAVAR